MLQLDDDGYPTEETLTAITAWDQYPNYRSLFDALHKVWKWADGEGWSGWTEDDFFDDVHDEPVRRYRLSTGGWSGNESLIGAMQRNFILWSQTWVQENRGGHYIFYVERAKRKEHELG